MQPTMLLVLIALATVSLDTVRLKPAQKTAPDVALPKGDGFVTVVGCVHGSRIKMSRDAQVANDLSDRILRASEYVLDGPRELLQQLRKEHDGHYDEVTGIVKVPPSLGGSRVTVQTKQLGKKTRVTMGQREASGLVESAPQPVRIFVQSFRHVSDRCAIR